ncbi:MAG TPA: hypothetical protein VEU75_05910, partial [Candidatus Acidoferrum sp.]|nr:hypothetical protein [Candidatus Acidoferrum sp.]
DRHQKIERCLCGEMMISSPFYKSRSHVERSETSLFMHAAVIDLEMTRDLHFAQNDITKRPLWY